MKGWIEFEESWADKLLKPDIQHGEWWSVDSDVLCGDDEQLHFPSDLFTKEQVFDMFADHVTRDDIELEKKWGARMSAPGYLDSTTWALFDTEEEAKEHLMEYFADDA